jgi:ribonuclease VapC
VKLFVDASALVAIIAGEPGSENFEPRMDDAEIRFVSATAIWESSRALAKIFDLAPLEALTVVERFADQMDLVLVPIGKAEGRAAVDAHDRFGKGRHDAGLNFGDCFAYACAATNGAELLYKGDDFAKTDLA